MVGNLCVVTVYTMSPKDPTLCPISSHTRHPPRRPSQTISQGIANSYSGRDVYSPPAVRRTRRQILFGIPPVRSTMLVAKQPQTCRNSVQTRPDSLLSKHQSQSDHSEWRGPQEWESCASNLSRDKLTKQGSPFRLWYPWIPTSVRWQKLRGVEETTW